MPHEPKALPNPASKTIEQISRDKESVKALIGAREAMAASIRRVETLEATLRLARSNIQDLGRSFNENIYFTVWIGGNKTTQPAPDVFRNIDNIIKAVL